MKKTHEVFFNLGEDRWLCTLLLSSHSGWYIDYCAAASAMANSPSTFTEFLEQRRRWITSSVLNQFSFIHNGKQIRSVNPYIHWYFIWLQLLVFVSDIIGPALVIIYMASSLTSIGYSETVAFFICTVPAAIEFYVCMFHSKKVQIFVTALLSAFVTVLFTMSVATSIFATFSEIDYFHGKTNTNCSEKDYLFNEMNEACNEKKNYATFVFPILIGIVIIVGMFHPGESKHLIYLPIFILGTPVTHVLFFIYAACNINDTTWGTREVNIQNTTTGSKKEPILMQFVYTIYETFLAWMLSKRKRAQDVLRSYDYYRLGKNSNTTLSQTSRKDTAPVYKQYNMNILSP
jgi:hypothetical protein